MLSLLFKSIDDSINRWESLHPDVLKVSQKKYRNNDFFEASRSAFIEVNSRIKRIREKIDGKIEDGVALMQSTFAPDNPILQVISRDGLTDKDFRGIQNGYKELFSGSISALRNPSAHENAKLNRHEAMRNLMLASLLMYKIDDAIIQLGRTFFEKEIHSMTKQEVTEFLDDRLPDAHASLLFQYHIEGKRGFELYLISPCVDVNDKKMTINEVISEAYWRLAQQTYKFR